MTANRLLFWPAVIAIVFLLLALLEWPYGFYTLLKWVVTGVAVYYAYTIYETLQKTNGWFWALAVIAVLNNPIAPIHLGDKGLWNIIDVVIVVFFIVLISIKFQTSEGGSEMSQGERLEAVKEYLKEHKEMTNREHRKITGASEATATRDLDELEKQGVVEQVGKTGKYVKYRLKS